MRLGSVCRHLKIAGRVIILQFFHVTSSNPESCNTSSCLIPDPVNARPFPSALTTMALGHSRRRWFGTCSCKPVPRGLPSSDKQLRATWPHGLSHSWRTIVGKPEVIHLAVKSPSRTIGLLVNG